MVPSFWLGLAVTTLGLLALHWAPWPRELRRLEAYTLGTGSILLGQYIWLGWCSEFRILALFPLLGGAGVALGYGIDELLNLIQRVRHHERDE